MAGPKYRMMPDKGTAINAVALAAVVVLFALVIFQGVTLVKMKQYNDDSQQFIEYWRHKTDSLSDENFKLYKTKKKFKSHYEVFVRNIFFDRYVILLHTSMILALIQ